MSTPSSTCYLCMFHELDTSGTYIFKGWTTYSAAPWEITLSGRSIATIFLEAHGDTYQEALDEMKLIVEQFASKQYGAREPWVQIRKWVFGTNEEQYEAREAVR